LKLIVTGIALTLFALIRYTPFPCQPGFSRNPGPKLCYEPIIHYIFRIRMNIPDGFLNLSLLIGTILILCGTLIIVIKRLDRVRVIADN